MKIIVQTEVNASLASVWDAWVTPADIRNWNFASEDWCCPRADIDLKVGGQFSYRMEAIDRSVGFDLEGIFTEIEPTKLLNYRLADNREVSVQFAEADNGIKVTETFDAESLHTTEQQQEGWQSILNNFKKYVESEGN